MHRSRTLRNRRNWTIAAVLGIPTLAALALWYMADRDYKSLGFSASTRDNKGKVELRVQEELTPRTNLQTSYDLPEFQTYQFPAR